MFTLCGKRISQPVSPGVFHQKPSRFGAGRQVGTDYILLDNGPGGTGETFDWSLLEDLQAVFF